MRHLLLTALTALTASVLLAADDPSQAPHRTFGAWHSGVIGGGGYLQQMVWAPSDAKRLYLSSDVGGCWRSDDGGERWRMLHGALPAEAASYSLRGIVVDPRDADIVLIAADSGVWRSTDAGRSWTRTLEAAWRGNGEHRAAGRILLIDRADPDTVYAAAIGSGVHISRDGGRTWTRGGPEGLYPVDLLQDVAEARRLWLSAAPAKVWIDGKQQPYAGGLFLSQDGGATWERLREQGVAEMVQRPGAPGVLIARTRDADRVARSTDLGRTWMRFDAGLAPPKDDARSDGSYGALVAGPDFVLLGGNGGSFYRLDTGSEVWSKVPWRREAVDEGDWWGGLKQPTHLHFGSALGWLAVDPRDPRHWAFTDWYALYRSRDAGSSWRLTLDGIEMTVIHVVAQHPGDPRRIHAGAADVGCFQSGDGGSTFRQNARGISNNVKHIAVCAGDPRRLYAVGPRSWHWHANQVFRSDDGGATWLRPKMHGLGDMAEKRCNTIAVHPQKPDECYLVLNGRIAPDQGGVWRSQDGGERWEWIGQGLPELDRCFRTDIWVAGPEVAVSGDGSLLACSDDRGRLFRRAAGAAAWQEVDFAGQPGGANAVVADPRTPGRFWFCRKEGGLWRSDDAGATWARMCDRNAWSMAVDAEDPRRIALNGAQGIFLSRDAGATWVELERSLPYRHFRNVVAFAGERLVVGTGGNGVFWSDLAAAPAGSVAMGERVEVGVR